MKVIIINGPMGVGKTTVGKYIAEKYEGTAFIDGDWCLDIHPFGGNRETKEMAIDNILHMIDNYRKCSMCKMNIKKPQEGVMLGIGLNYIRFAIREPNLFRFLFQSGFAVGNSLLEMIDSEELLPVLSAMQGAMGMDIKQTKEVFLTIAMFAHGYASIIANNSLEYDEKLVAAHLERAYRGAVSAVQNEKGKE